MRDCLAIFVIFLPTVLIVIMLVDVKRMMSV